MFVSEGQKETENREVRGAEEEAQREDPTLLSLKTEERVIVSGMKRMKLYMLEKEGNGFFPRASCRSIILATPWFWVTETEFILLNFRTT